MNSNQQKLKNKQYQHSYDWISQFDPKWITDKIDDDAIIFADKFGRFLKENKMTTSQIRNFFGEIKRIQMNGFDKNISAFKLLKPKVAYSVGRETNAGKKQILAEFKKIFDLAHSYVKNPNHFENFVAFFEAILAYHKFYGGK